MASKALATIVQFPNPDLVDLLAAIGVVVTDEFRDDLNAYLSRQPTSPVASMQEIVDSGFYQPQITFTTAIGINLPGDIMGFGVTVSVAFMTLTLREMETRTREKQRVVGELLRAAIPLQVR
jgi:hypothetical protein